MTVQINEILGRSTQGLTEPFICRADNNETYFVKGIGAGRRDQICEWIAGNLALSIGLPIAPFELVSIPEELVEGNPDYTALGSGLAFGSCKQIITELNYQGIAQIPNELQRLVLAFDWWIKNEDRQLSPLGGNPNLLWEPTKEQLVIIDHNRAFDTDFSVDNFMHYHVFCGKVEELFTDFVHRLDYEKMFKSALTQWDKIYEGIPDAWFYLDPEMTIPVNFNSNSILGTLQRCNTDSFWNTP